MGHRAMRIKPPRWTHVYTDRHGKLTCYLRQPGRSKVRLPGLPWSPEFMEARELALKGDSGKEGSGSSSYVPKEPEKDTQLQYALKVLRGEIAVEATKNASSFTKRSGVTPNNGLCSSTVWRMIRSAGKLTIRAG